MTNRDYTRTPLTTNQHILHLLISVFTFGFWIPVWIILSTIGNRTYDFEQPGHAYVQRPGMPKPPVPPGYGSPRWPDAPAHAAPPAGYR